MTNELETIRRELTDIIELFDGQEDVKDGGWAGQLPNDAMKACSYTALAALNTLAAEIEALRANVLDLSGVPEPFQVRVDAWINACFGEAIRNDKIERNHRFLEEAIELAQACDCTASEAHQLVDYVFGRSIGDPTQEVGGVMNTLAAICNIRDINLDEAAERELVRIWGKIEVIRAKQKAKPKHSPLPEAPSAALASAVERARDAADDKE